MQSIKCYQNQGNRCSSISPQSADKTQLTSYLEQNQVRFGDRGRHFTKIILKTKTIWLRHFKLAKAFEMMCNEVKSSSHTALHFLLLFRNVVNMNQFQNLTLMQSSDYIIS